jgi:hypothetical protein
VRDVTTGADVPSHDADEVNVVPSDCKNLILYAVTGEPSLFDVTGQVMTTPDPELLVVAAVNVYGIDAARTDTDAELGPVP